MRFALHDFAGHAFSFQLSRELIRRGHEVCHIYFADLAGPKGGFELRPEEVGRLRVEAVRAGTFAKYSVISRFFAHRKYRAQIIGILNSFNPDCIISGNTPTDIESHLCNYASKKKISFLHWVQDFYSVALENLLVRKIGAAGHLAAIPFHRMEQRIFRKSTAVVYITPDFDDYARGHGYLPRRSCVIENWASLEEITPQPRDNPFSRKYGLHDKYVFLYAGTMGLKHNPQALVGLALEFSGNPDVAVVVVSEGIGRSFLEKEKAAKNLVNLHLLDFQPYEDLPLVLGCANTVIATLEVDSSVFCVPSKVLSYCCSGRSLLISAPQENLICRMVERAEAGFSCAPHEVDRFNALARQTYEDPELCRFLGANARLYAEKTFHISRIGDSFLKVIAGTEEG